MATANIKVQSGGGIGEVLIGPQGRAGAALHTTLTNEETLVNSSEDASAWVIYRRVTACPVVPLRVKSNRTCIMRRDGVSAGGNVHFLAASMATRWK